MRVSPEEWDFHGLNFPLAPKQLCFFLSAYPYVGSGERQMGGGTCQQ